MAVVIQEFEAVAESARGEAPAAEGGASAERKAQIPAHELERELARMAARALRRWAH